MKFCLFVYMSVFYSIIKNYGTDFYDFSLSYHFLKLLGTSCKYNVLGAATMMVVSGGGG